MGNVDLEYRDGSFLLTGQAGNGSSHQISLTRVAVEQLLLRCSQALALEAATDTDQAALQTPMVDALDPAY